MRPGRDDRLAHVIEQVGRDDILPLRRAVLRPNLPPETAIYPEDGHAEIFHLAARSHDGEIIACVTFFPEHVDGDPAWRLRGMATAPEHRNRGLGGELLEAGVAEAGRRGARRVWCNGRSGAASFYRRHGFVAGSAEFDLPPIGPHFLFVREL
jgi:predicted N-acetyltransferase YhbS